MNILKNCLKKKKDVKNIKTLRVDHFIILHLKKKVTFR